MTQLGGCKSVQRRSFQLTDVNAWRSVTQQESRRTWTARCVSLRVAHASRVPATFPAKIVSARRRKSEADWRWHARRARYLAAALLKWAGFRPAPQSVALPLKFRESALVGRDSVELRR